MAIRAPDGAKNWEGNEENSKKNGFFSTKKAPRIFFSKPVPECTHRARQFGTSKPIGKPLT